MTEEKKGYTKEEIQERFNIKSADELINLDIPEQKWLVKNLIPESSFIVWTGSKASFKSFLNKYLGICIATGKPVFEKYEILKQGNVLYLDEENGTRRLRARIKKICAGLEIKSSETINFYPIIKKGFKLDEDIKNKRFIKWLELIIQIYKPVLIICDSLVRMMTGDENSSKDVRRIFDNLSSLMEKYGCTFSMIHHSCKDGSGFRGSGDFEYMADKTFFVKRKKGSRNDFCIQQEKERDNDFLGNIGFSVLDSEDKSKIYITELLEDFGEHEDNKKQHELMADKIQEFMKVGKTYKKSEINEFLGKKSTDATIQKALEELKAGGIIKKAGYGYYERKK